MCLIYVGESTRKSGPSLLLKAAADNGDKKENIATEALAIALLLMMGLACTAWTRPKSSDLSLAPYAPFSQAPGDRDPGGFDFAMCCAFQGTGVAGKFRLRLLS